MKPKAKDERRKAKAEDEGEGEVGVFRAEKARSEAIE
jgi:hypothetical protein